MPEARRLHWPRRSTWAEPTWRAEAPSPILYAEDRIVAPMRVTRIQYTVKPEYAETNAANIEKVMAALRDQPIDGLRYSAFRRPDGNTFVHLVLAKDEETQGRISELPEFQEFQQALIASGPTSPPVPEPWDLVATSAPLS